MKLINFPYKIFKKYTKSLNETINANDELEAILHLKYFLLRKTSDYKQINFEEIFFNLLKNTIHTNYRSNAEFIFDNNVAEKVFKLLEDKYFSDLYDYNFILIDSIILNSQNEINLNFLEKKSFLEKIIKEINSLLEERDINTKIIFLSENQNRSVLNFPNIFNFDESNNININYLMLKELLKNKKFKKRLERKIQLNGIIFEFITKNVI